MAALFERIGAGIGQGALAAFMLLAALATASSAAAETGPAYGSNTNTITVVLDQARVMKLPDDVATLVVGNPLIADVSLQPGGVIVLTGKGYGVTNLLALDRSGTVLSQRSIQVLGPRENVVVVQRGMDRESYSCAPRCEPRATLGDSPAFFGAAMGQIGARTGQAQGGVQASR